MWKSCADFPEIGLLSVEKQLQLNNDLVQLTNEHVNWHPHRSTFSTLPFTSHRSVKVRVGGEEEDEIQTAIGGAARV